MAREGSENEQKMDDDDVKCEVYLLRLMNVLEHVLKVVHAIGWMWRQLHSTGQYSTPLDAQHTISSTTGGRCLAWRGRQEAEGVQAGGRGCAGRRHRVCTCSGLVAGYINVHWGGGYRVLLPFTRKLRELLLLLLLLDHPKSQLDNY